MTNDTPRCKLTSEGNVAIAELLDRKILDEQSISAISQQLYALAAGADQPRIVVDFVNVRHMSSSALGMLITLHKRVREKDGHLRLCAIDPSIYEVFAITRLDQVFKICDTREEAAREAASA